MATPVKDQDQPEAGHEEPIDPAAGASKAPTQTAGAGPVALQEVQRAVEHLQERVHDLEHREGPPAAAGVFSDPDHAPSGVSLEDVLPRIKDLAQCVGGMKELARIVTMLAETRE